MKTIHVEYWYERPKNFTGLAINQYGDKAYYQNDKLHRTDGGPAIEWLNGDKEYWQNDKRHRLNGPAIEYTDGDKYWYIFGQRLTEEEYNQKVKEIQQHQTKTEPKISSYQSDTSTIKKLTEIIHDQEREIQLLKEQLDRFHSLSKEIQKNSP